MGAISKNIQYARQAVRDSLMRGEAPIASHLLYTQEGILWDAVLVERELGMMAGWSWIKVAHLVAVYTDLGISPGMERGIKIARQMHVAVERRKIL